MNEPIIMRAAGYLRPFLATLFLTATPIVATADTFGPYTYTVTDGHATITDFDSSYSGALSITNELGGCRVTFIGDFAFQFCTSLANISIPSSVTIIGYCAFESCTSVTSVTVPSSVITIDDFAFASCFALTNISVDSANTCYSSEQGILFDKTQATLIQCPAGKSGGYTIPSSVTIIGDYAFFYCTSLTSVTIPSSVTYIGGAFYSCTSLTNVTIPSSVTTIGDYAFFPCTALTSVSIPSNVTTIGDSAFNNCTSLSNVTIPSSVTTIGDNAFENCTSLSNVTIPSSVTYLGNWAFAHCTSLTNVTIPSSVTTIGSFLFYHCTALSSVYFAGIPPASGWSLFVSSPATLYYLPAFASSWPATYADRPTKLWNPSFTEPAFTAGAISCSVTGSPPIPIALEATTNLTTGPWVRLCTTNLTDNSITLPDPDFSSHPTRFYRIVGP
ncbi:MAG: leucine-rich repeat domain-containing protein [Kiritimatiellae bacterium]|nr:leucine-rich repeat domain-containing protein [Kiritimatiellia bacterium]